MKAKSVKKLLEELDFSLAKEEMLYLKKETEGFTELLKEGILKEGIDADVFVGGSFAKGTLAGCGGYDVDIFVRFDWKYENLSNLLEKILKEVVRGAGLEMKRWHGSRDYFLIEKEKLTFEVIPVLRIKKVNEARNVMDLSYFHVNYVKKNLTKNMTKELILAKKFCKGAGVYGAESFIHGFSGYGLECLIVYYKTFERMIKDMVKIENGRKVIDLKRFYKNETDVLFELNESKTRGPIILVDPTWKERNVLAGLSWEVFREFQRKARAFLKKPSKDFFEVKEFNVSDFKKLAKEKRAEFVEIKIGTARQEGDIAGTKMKKFARILMSAIGKYFEIFENKFEYEWEKDALLYLIVKSKKEILRQGPPTEMQKAAERFKSANKGKVFEKDKELYAREKINFSAREFLEKFKKENRERMEKEWGIRLMELIK